MLSFTEQMLFTYLAWQLKNGWQGQPVDASNDGVSVLVVSLDIGSTLLPVVSTSGILYNFEISRQLWGFCHRATALTGNLFLRFLVPCVFANAFTGSLKSHFTSVVEQH